MKLVAFISKLTIFGGVNCQVQDDIVETLDGAVIGDENEFGRTERRYQQLITQMNFYNKDFDPRRYWGYGCNCFHLGDRPMSEGLGNHVVDELDNTCKSYKECLKCATMTYGDTCVPELKRYKFTLSSNSLQCRNRAGSCERALCECDHMLARTHVTASEKWDIQYHTFWGGWDYQQSCEHPKSPGLRSMQKGCCNNQKSTSYFSLYAIDRQECCQDGEVAPIGGC